MAYRIDITSHAEELIDNLVHYLLFKLKNEQAAIHLLNGIDSVYNRLEENPFQFPLARDIYLAARGYYEAIVPEMNYNIIFSIEEEVVYIMGVFHQLEHYEKKI